MSQSKRPTGHLQVKTDKNGRTRSFWAFWRDRNGRKGAAASVSGTSATLVGEPRAALSSGEPDTVLSQVLST
jgi:hypothetical protein